MYTAVLLKINVSEPADQNIHLINTIGLGTVPNKLLTTPDASLDVNFGDLAVLINMTIDVDKVIHFQAK